MAVRLIDADADAGFNYPYFLCTPDSLGPETPVPILVETTNMPEPTDDFEAHIEEASGRAHGGFGRRVADELTLPFVHPVFPRPVSDPVDWTHYTHSLDAETLAIASGPLERIDRQLLAMVADARDRLSEQRIPTMERFMLNGFSASAKFANRFSALHPETLISVSAGGLDGTLILPREEAAMPVGWIDRTALPYPVGTANIEALTGKPFNIGAFRELPQFLYLGEHDESDTLLYPDAWTDPKLRAIAIGVYGEDVHEQRFPYCKTAYTDAGVSAVFRTYNTGHDPRPAMDDVVEFHKRTLAGDDIDGIRAALSTS